MVSSRQNICTVLVYRKTACVWVTKEEVVLIINNTVVPIIIIIIIVNKIYSVYDDYHPSLIIILGLSTITIKKKNV